MEDFVKLTLSRMDIGQILDGLRERMKAWKGTYEYFKKGHADLCDIIEECSDANEAKAIADYYAKIIKDIEKQLKTASKQRQEGSHE
jgi:hypothetical protein